MHTAFHGRPTDQNLNVSGLQACPISRTVGTASFETLHRPGTLRTRPSRHALSVGSRAARSPCVAARDRFFLCGTSSTVVLCSTDTSHWTDDSHSSHRTLSKFECTVRKIRGRTTTFVSGARRSAHRRLQRRAHNIYHKSPFQMSSDLKSCQ